MEKKRYIGRLVNIITRIFHSLDDTIDSSSIKVKYLGDTQFDSDKLMDQYCFQFEKINSQDLWFELLLPTENISSHTLDLDTFSKQIVYKYNIENIANYISVFGSTTNNQCCHFEKKFIFEVAYNIIGKELNIVYINLDPENFFE